MWSIFSEWRHRHTADRAKSEHMENVLTNESRVKHYPWLFLETK